MADLPVSTLVTQEFVDALNANFAQVAGAAVSFSSNFDSMRVAQNVQPLFLVVFGGIALNDGNGGFFVWVEGDTTPDDNQNVIHPYGSSGNYNRFNFAINFG